MRIGTPCQILLDLPGRHPTGDPKWEQIVTCKVGTIRVADVKHLNGREARHKIHNKVEQNLRALVAQVEIMAEQPEGLRMLRISSELFPLIDHPNYMHHYTHKYIANRMQSTLGYVGRLAKRNNVRLSVHPSQFITLFSDRDEVVDNGLRHVKIWITLFKLMKLEPVRDGVVIVMHTNGRSFTFPERANEVKDWVGLENDEKKAGFEKTLKICQDNGIRMILDVHHYRCENKIDLDVNSKEVEDVLRTWVGKGRPKMHISSSRGTEGFKEQCAHADRIHPNDMQTYWEFAYRFDIMAEAKHKNLASRELYDFVVEKTNFNH